MVLSVLKEEPRDVKSSVLLILVMFASKDIMLIQTKPAKDVLTLV